MMNGYGGIGGMGVGASLLMVLVWVAVLLLVVWAVRALFPGTHGTARAEPLDLLKQRYAAGEISYAEYEQARRAIE
jgi:putative membrane protein